MIFLSYNSSDQKPVRELYEALVQRGMDCWFDQIRLLPSSTFREIERGVRDSQVILVCLGPSGLGPWQEKEVEAALSLGVREKKPIVLVILPRVEGQPEVPLFLMSRTWLDLRSGITSESIDHLVNALPEARPEPEARVHLLDRELAEVRQLASVPGRGTTLPTTVEPGMALLFGAILENIAKAKNRLKKALGDPANSQQAKDEELEIALSSIRAELRRVQKLNDPELLQAFEPDFRAFNLEGHTPGATSEKGGEEEEKDEPVTKAEIDAAYNGIHTVLDARVAGNPRLGEFCAALSLPVVKSDGPNPTFHLSATVKEAKYLPKNDLRALAQSLTPRHVTELGSSDEIHILASGLASFGIAPEWLVRTRRKIKTGKVRYPGLQWSVAIGKGEEVHLIPLLAAAIADTVVRLDAIFDFQALQEARTLTAPKIQRGVNPKDKARQFKLHLIEQVLGKEMVPREDDERRIDLVYTRMKAAMRVALEKGEGYLASDDSFTQFEGSLQLDDLIFLEPSGDELEDTFFPEIVAIFSHLKTIYTTLCKATA